MILSHLNALRDVGGFSYGQHKIKNVPMVISKCSFERKLLLPAKAKQEQNRQEMKNERSTVYNAKILPTTMS